MCLIEPGRKDRVLLDWRREFERNLLTIRIRIQFVDTHESDSDVHRERMLLEVRTAKTERLCIASPGGDHARAITCPSDCSSPIDMFSKDAGGGHGQSTSVKALILKRT